MTAAKMCQEHGKTVTGLVSHWLLLNCVMKTDIQSKSMERVNIYIREEEKRKDLS